MKKVWREAMGRMKDRNSQWMASLAWRSSNNNNRNPNIDKVLIKATSHDRIFVDYENIQRVFNWVKTSPVHLTMVLWALTRRVNHTRDWVVTTKSLILLHGILCTKAVGINQIGRLPFDLSGFNDGHTRNGLLRWAHNAFVRAYFVFLDMKSVVLTSGPKEETVGPTLVRVRRWQDLLDAVLQVRPQRKGMLDDVLVLEAMECMVVEVFDLHSNICDGIAKSLMRIYTDKLGKVEASTALTVLRRATSQSRELSDYFEYCKRFGLLHESECPKVEEIPKEDLAELERIINGDEVLSDTESSEKSDSEEGNYERSMMIADEKRHVHTGEISKQGLKTVITDRWEVFDDDDDVRNLRKGNASGMIDPLSGSQSNPTNVYGGNHSSSQLVISLL